MGLLDDVQESDSAAFADSDVFGESVVYVNRAGTTRTITASVHRDPIEARSEFDQGVNPTMTIIVRNDSTYGIAMSEFNSGGDRIRVAYRRGGTTADYLLSPPVAHDAGMLTFTINKA